MEEARDTKPDLIAPHGRVVMVSGASRGIGAAVARRLLGEGFSVSVGVRQPAETRVKFSGLDSGRLLVSRFNAFEPPTAQSWVDETIARFGRLDALINNAGILKPLSFAEGDESVLDELWAVNVKAPFRMIRLALPYLARSGHGRIINVASTDAKRYRDSTVSIAYAMTKQAVVALSHAAKFAGWEHGVRVTALCPGAVETDLLKGLAGVTLPGSRIAPATLAEIVALLLRLPNTASVAELIVNTRLEATI
ncbi:MAG: SDR family NAD(P)-dependent oxidoreductase [Methylobacteriaceae bacterium]|nr:SDR family NAD(P)-dependent oxidoreductase [Methylobacteriaceae bacterium]